MTAWTVNSEPALQTLIGDMRDLFRSHKYLKVSAKVGKARSLDQNAISHEWYGQIASELREDDALGVKCFCKLHFGVPILRAEDEEFRAFYDASIKGMTQSTLAELSGLYASHVSDYLSDKPQSRNLPADKVADFEAVCGNRAITQWEMKQRGLTIMEQVLAERKFG